MKSHTRPAFRPEVSPLITRHIDELREELRDRTAIDLFDRIPAFELRDHHGSIVRSSELLANGPLVISLFRGTWCPYCTLELRAFDEAYPEIRSLGAELVVISPQTPESAARYFAEQPVAFPVLVDENSEFANALGLAYDFPDYLTELYRDVFKIDLERINAGGLWRLPMPARLVVDDDGGVVDVQFDPDYRNRPAPEETIETLARLNG